MKKHTILVFLFYLLFSQVLYSQSKDRLLLDDFLENPFAFKPDIEYFRENFADRRISYELMENIHVEGQTDTIFTIDLNRTKVKIYKAKEKTLPMEIIIGNRRLDLKNDIKKRMKRNEFFAQFKDIETRKGDRIELSGEQDFAKMYLIFKRDKLRNIKILYSLD